VAVLIVTMFDDDSVFAAMRAGARGYLLKGAEADETVRAVRAVANGEAIFRQALISHMITAKHAARIMIREGRGLIVEVTENDILGGRQPLANREDRPKMLALNMAAESRRTASRPRSPRGSCARVDARALRRHGGELA
jgi:hypothetical protein